MIPLGDETRRPERLPIITVTLVVLNVLAFLWELVAGDDAVANLTVVPATLLQGQGLFTPFTAMFLHAGFMHIAGNMVFLAAFAPAVEDLMGRPRFLLFYLVGGLAATAAQVLTGPSSTVPELGASGAIAAVMGAFLVTYPRDRIKVLWFLGFFVTVTRVPAYFLVGLWLLTQVLNQAGAVIRADSGGVAYAAHVGGAIFGIIAVRFFERPTMWRVES